MTAKTFVSHRLIKGQRNTVLGCIDERPCAYAGGNCETEIRVVNNRVTVYGCCGGLGIEKCPHLETVRNMIRYDPKANKPVKIDFVLDDDSFNDFFYKTFEPIAKEQAEAKNKCPKRCRTVQTHVEDGPIGVVTGHCGENDFVRCHAYGGVSKALTKGACSEVHVTNTVGDHIYTVTRDGVQKTA